MNIVTSRILKHPKIILTILKNFPTLDPLIILINSPIYILFIDNQIVGFVSIKRWGKITELGTLYIYPKFRGKGYIKYLYNYIVKEHNQVYLLCKPNLVFLYLKYGFFVDNNPIGVIWLRKILFDLCIKPFVGYKIIVMKNYS